jgi:hypothetical protein
MHSVWGILWHSKGLIKTAYLEKGLLEIFRCAICALETLHLIGLGRNIGKEKISLTQVVA